MDFILKVSESHWGKGEKARRPLRRLGENEQMNIQYIVLEIVYVVRNSICFSFRVNSERLFEFHSLHASSLARFVI